MGIFFTNPGHGKFAQYYKRNKYENEKETRLSLYYPNDIELFGKEHDLGKTEFLSIFKDGKIEDKRFISVPLDNKLFELKIKNICYGATASENDVNLLKDMCAKNSITVKCRIKKTALDIVASAKRNGQLKKKRKRLAHIKTLESRKPSQYDPTTAVAYNLFLKNKTNYMRNRNRCKERNFNNNER